MVDNKQLDVVDHHHDADSDSEEDEEDTAPLLSSSNTNNNITIQSQSPAVSIVNSSLTKTFLLTNGTDGSGVSNSTSHKPHASASASSSFSNKSSKLPILKTTNNNKHSNSPNQLHLSKPSSASPSLLHSTNQSKDANTSKRKESDFGEVDDNKSVSNADSDMSLENPNNKVLNVSYVCSLQKKPLAALIVLI